MDAFKGTIKVTVFLLAFFALSFSSSLFAADGLFLSFDKKAVSIENQCGKTAVNKSADNETEEPAELNPLCFVDAFINLFIDLLEGEDTSSVFESFFNCLLGCINGADSCEDELTIDPDFVTVKPGDTKRFTATGGTKPYEFRLLSNNSGAEIVPVGDSMIDYTAGETKEDVTDIVRVEDSVKNTADANIVVSTEICSFVVGPEGGDLDCSLGISLEFPAGAVESITTCSITLDETPEAFPSYLEPFSQAFNVQLGVKLKLPVKITFDNIDSAADGALGIYILEYGSWAFAGGMREGTSFYSYVKDLSVFMVGKGQKKHKSLSFEKVFGESWVNATVAQYILADPKKDVPISTAYSWPVNDEETVSFPQGKYQFCIEEDDGTGRGWYHDLKCSFGPVYDCVLSENQNVLPVEFNPNLFMDKDSCPPCENMTEPSE